MIHIKEAVIVEGKYDKIKLSSIIDGLIIETNGFAIFRDKEQLALIQRLAESNGILIMTDGDAAGFKIRSFLKGAIPSEYIKHVYIPDIFGKEKRKATASKEGKLGVEGIPKEAILAALHKAGVFTEQSAKDRRLITKTDFFNDGLTGKLDSAQKRRLLLKHMNLPERLSTNGLLDLLNATITYDEYSCIMLELAKNSTFSG